MLDVSIVIVSYNTKDLLKECLKSIFRETSGVRYEVVVVDNCSSDGSVAMVRDEFPDVIVVEAGGNLGFGRANNLGMKSASGKYLFLLNSDTIVQNNAVGAFYEKAECLRVNGHKVGVLGSILLGKDSKPCHSYGRFITPGRELREVLAKYIRSLKDPENTRPPFVSDMKSVDYVTGADMFVSREAYLDTDGFDPDFFMYCEEVDWQKRMHAAGYGRYVVEGPRIMHLEGGSDSGEKKLWSPQRLANLYKSRQIYRKKHYNKLILPFFSALRLLLDLPSILLISCMSRRKEYLRLIKLK